MNKSEFGHWLKDPPLFDAPANLKYIVCFEDSHSYNHCLNLIRSQSLSTAATEAKPLQLIQGICCTKAFLPQIKAMHANIASIESDGKLAVVHAKSEPFIPWGICQIRAPQVWGRTTGKQIKIGVIDTGVDYSHPDLQQSVQGGVNLIYPHLLPMDDNGHGTHIAGTIAASSHRSGMIGVAPHGEIYAVKAFDHNGTAYVSDIVQAIDWCVHYQIDIINMSFGMNNCSKALKTAISNAYSKGKVIVASSGNSGKLSHMDYPARLPQTIAVGATTRSHKIAPFSNRSHYIDIYAPGDKIYSTWLHGKYNVLSGTSMATSHVTGVIALLLAAKPNLTPAKIKTVLQRYSLALEANKRRTTLPGEVSAAKTLQALIR